MSPDYYNWTEAYWAHTWYTQLWLRVVYGTYEVIKIMIYDVWHQKKWKLCHNDANMFIEVEDNLSSLFYGICITLYIRQWMDTHLNMEFVSIYNVIIV